MKKQRIVLKEMIFENDGNDFSAYYAAENWLHENGYSHGSMCAPMPIGLLKGNYYIAKWKNLTTSQINKLDGVMVSDRFREASVKIQLYNI